MLFFCRFSAIYFGLYCLPYALSLIPGANYLQGLYWESTTHAARWAAKSFFGVSTFIDGPNGSGDTVVEYVRALILLAIAFIVASITSFISEQTWEDTAFTAVQLMIRLSLGGLLIGYGLAKIIPPGQFPHPSIANLAVPLGESSPMGLLWTFMGSSRAYCNITGGLEVLAGIMLFIPRLSLLGALLSIAIMANVFFLNMCYDVPVKLFSGHLLILSAFLVLPGARQLFNFFVLQVPTTFKGPAELFEQGRWNQVALGIQVLLLAFTLYSTIRRDLKFGEQFRQRVAEIKLLGIWSITPSHLSDSSSWARLAFDHKSRMYAFSNDGQMQRFQAKYDYEKMTIELKGMDDLKIEKNFSFSLNQNQTEVVLEESANATGEKIKLTKQPDPQYLLNNRGFRWINEMPFNR
ncbi:hypothetical protein ACLVWU_07175 [Bdellovibrio sp. HCB290]|uniref:hypothetical protein n=1 Tax=Bdellovibrio sp. HCB290 TaxID=3394356 RepID=UPI0039B4C95B